MYKVTLDSSVKFYSVYIIIYLTIPSYFQLKIFFFLCIAILLFVVSVTW